MYNRWERKQNMVALLKHPLPPKSAGPVHVFSDLLSGHFVHCMSCKESVMFQQCNEAVACSFCIQHNYIHLFTAKLQALVYDILPPTIAITDYAIGLKKLLANGQFFVGAQIVLSL